MERMGLLNGFLKLFLTVYKIMVCGIWSVGWKIPEQYLEPHRKQKLEWGNGGSK